MRNAWIGIGGLLGLSAVALGAFGAHALKGRLDDRALSSFEVGVRYQMYHALFLVLIGILARTNSSRLLVASGICALVGVAFFSGSIYGLTLRGWSWLGPVTPIGGAALMAAWLLLAAAAFVS